jgi:predicted metal-dependent hydrolase
VLFLLRAPLPDIDELMLDGEPLVYAIRTSARRSMALHVLPDGSVRVAAPRRTSLSVVRAFVAHHGTWLRRKQQEIRARPAPALADGVNLVFLDESLVLRFGTPTGRGRVLRRGDELWLYGAASRRRALLEAWYRRRAAEHASARLDHFASLVGRRPQRLSIRGQRTRWGSCSGLGSITLNWRLMQAPAALFDYVLVHELCHLLQRNHSPRFWSEVARVMPDFRERRRCLRAAAREFVL